jgi:hypothetical protein
MTHLETIDGYTPTLEDWDNHVAHEPDEDRWDDCSLCWADVISEEQRDWLMKRGQSGEGNSIAETMGLRPQRVDEAGTMERREVKFSFTMTQPISDEPDSLAYEIEQALKLVGMRADVKIEM